jgi:hypothetical protein
MGLRHPLEVTQPRIGVTCSIRTDTLDLATCFLLYDLLDFVICCKRPLIVIVESLAEGVCFQNICFFLSTGGLSSTQSQGSGWGCYIWDLSSTQSQGSVWGCGVVKSLFSQIWPNTKHIETCPGFLLSQLSHSCLKTSLVVKYGLAS